MPNPRCFFDIAVEGEQVGRVIFELFADAVPKTAENFRALCTGSAGVNELGVPLYYKGTPFHRIIAGFMVQGGDFTQRNGKGGESIYGGTFEDEDLRREIDSEGLLVMANRGKNTNGSQFFVSLRPCPHLLGKHVVFGRVVKGYEVIEAISKVPVNEKDHPLQLVTIAHCGELERKAPVKKVRSPSPSPTPSRSPSPVRRGRSASRSRSPSRAPARSPSRSRSRSPVRRRVKSASRSRSRSNSRSRSRSPSPSRKRSRKHKHRSSHRSSKKRSSHRRHRSPSSSPELTDEQITALKEQARREEQEEERKRQERMRELEEIKRKAEKEIERTRTSGGGEAMIYKGRGAMKAPRYGGSAMRGWND